MPVVTMKASLGCGALTKERWLGARVEGGEGTTPESWRAEEEHQLLNGDCWEGGHLKVSQRLRCYELSTSSGGVSGQGSEQRCRRL